ncbi:collectin sub-family member 12 [Mytilus galloprovincialis]|uniref:Collectin sub-family member 12 n=1 Tax=Mytilus galloprovincialis TaxID=29158 RepID=A0A8B6FYM4_MYTGA|nr:collectin sub-family member 12 [Mytilus galloprovincialis]
MVGLMSVWKLIFLILWSIGFLIFTSCVKAPTYEFDLQLYQVDETLLECPTGWLKFRNQCYYIVQEEATFQQADILCKRYGGHLVKTDGYNSNQGIGKLISNHNISNVWIGLQRKKSGEFWWSDGQLAEAADGFWTTQLPIKSTEYDLCTVMTTTLSDNGEYRWTLSNCDIGYSSVCQTSACVAGQFRCSDGSGCLSRSWICDGIHQCSDKSDELMCPGN